MFSTPSLLKEVSNVKYKGLIQKILEIESQKDPRNAHAILDSIKKDRKKI